MSVVLPACLARLGRALLPALLLMACQSSLSTSLDGRPCDALGRCASGYTCDATSNLCVHPGAGSCHEGETVCGTKCAVLSTDAANCGGCDAQCTAPDHGQPVCLQSRCNFACDEGY